MPNIENKNSNITGRTSVKNFYTYVVLTKRLHNSRKKTTELQWEYKSRD